MKKIVLTKKAHWIEIGAGIILLGLFFLFTWLLIRSSDRLMRSNLLQKAEHVSLAINYRFLGEFSGTRSDVELVQYQRLKEQLQLVRILYPDTRSLYLLGMNPDGSIFIQIDSEEPGSP
ncbi:MAG TPA: hypothetical protein VK856_11540, partial [Anaerolineaceae bacterium]|nr:hypothetical protein [Anaerolineaceae bacterium]